MLGNAAFLNSPVPTQAVPSLLPHHNLGQSNQWNPNTQNGVNFKNGFLGFHSQQSLDSKPQITPAKLRQQIATSNNLLATGNSQNHGNKFWNLRNNDSGSAGLLENTNKKPNNENGQNIQTFANYGQQPTANNHQANFYQTGQANLDKNQYYSSHSQRSQYNQQGKYSNQQNALQQQYTGHNKYFSNTDTQFRHNNTAASSASTFTTNNVNKDENFLKQNSWFFAQQNNHTELANQTVSANTTSNTLSNNTDSFNQTTSATNSTQTEEEDNDDDDKNSLEEEIEKQKEAFEEQIEEYKEWLEEEEDRKEKLETLQRYAILMIPFFIFDRESAAYFAATELFSVYLERIGFSDEINTLIMLFVQCVDIRAFAKGRFKFVEGFQVNWYQELYDYIMTKAGVDDRIRLGSQMFMPQSPMPEYEDTLKKRRKKRDAKDRRQQLVDIGKRYSKLFAVGV